MGLDLVLAANMLALSKDKVVAGVVVVVADYAGDDEDVADYDADGADDGHLWSDL